MGGQDAPFLRTTLSKPASRTCLNRPHPTFGGHLIPLWWAPSRDHRRGMRGTSPASDDDSVETAKSGCVMRFAEQSEGDFRVYAAALEAPGGGYHAAVVVRECREQGAADQEVFRDERLEDGQVWPSAGNALVFALSVGVAAIHAQRVMREYLAQLEG